jgi:hypothetical protein
VDPNLERTMHLADSDPIGRRAGQYARATVRRLRLRTRVGLGVLAVSTAMLGRGFGLHSPLFLASEVALLASMFVISRYVLPLVERRDRGAMAEEHVGALLESLPHETWRIVHDVSLGRGNVDHIAIGPPGVFTIETKSHPGPVRAGRMHGGTLAQARAQGRAISWITGIEAESLVVFSRAWVDRPGTRRKGVRILPARMLVGYLEKRPTTLSQADVERTHRSLATAVRQQRQRGRTPGERWALIR